MVPLTAGTALVGLVLPASLAGGRLAFAVSGDGALYPLLCDQAGAPLTVTIPAGAGALPAAIPLDPALFLGWTSLKLRTLSGTTGLTDAPQTAIRTLSLIPA